MAVSYQLATSDSCLEGNHKADECLTVVDAHRAEMGPWSSNQFINVDFYKRHMVETLPQKVTKGKIPRPLPLPFLANLLSGLLTASIQPVGRCTNTYNQLVNFALTPVGERVPVNGNP